METSGGEAKGRKRRRRTTKDAEPGASPRDVRRLLLMALAAAAVVVALVWLWRRERSWTVLVAPVVETTSPWTAVDVVAKVFPAPDDASGWSWTWSVSPSGRIEGSGSSVTFRGAAANEYRIHVAVRSPRGTERSADTTITVHVPAFRVGLGQSTETTDTKVDPFPEILRPDLPFRITRVTVEKPEVCRGERVVIRVEAEDDGGNADMLVPTIAGKVGWVASVVVPGDAPGPYKIPVRLGDPNRGDPAKPFTDFVQTGAFVTLKDCDTPRSLWVSAKQPTEHEEDVRFHATVRGDPADLADSGAPSAYRWDFGDGSPSLLTKGPDARHVFPDEEHRGPRKRIFSYVAKAEALDVAGNVLLSGSMDIYMRNHIEELKKTDHQLRLLVVFHPEPQIDGDGSRFIDVVLKNLDPDETASLTSLKFRRVPCAVAGPTPDESHAVSEVFADSVIAPRGSISGRLRWPKDGATDVCHVNVSIEGTSRPGALSVGGGFSMRTGFDDGAQASGDPEQSAAIKKAMGLLHKNYVTQQDLEALVASGEIPESALKIPSKPSRGAP